MNLALVEIKGRMATSHKASSQIQLMNRDVPALITAVEAVLELHKENAWTNRDGTWTTRTCEHCMSASDGAVTYPCPTVTAINQALGEQA